MDSVNEKAPLRHEHLVLPGVLSEEQKNSIFSLINILMVDTGVEKRLTAAAEANISEFRANVIAMFERVRNDFEPLLFDAVDSLAAEAEEATTAFLDEFSSLVTKKQEAEAKLNALAADRIAVQEAVLRVQKESVQALGDLFKTKIKSFHEKAEDASPLSGRGATATDLRAVLAEVRGLAKGISGFGPLKNKAVKERILELTEKYVRT